MVWLAEGHCSGYLEMRHQMRISLSSLSHTQQEQRYRLSIKKLVINASDGTNNPWEHLIHISFPQPYSLRLVTIVYFFVLVYFCLSNHNKTLFKTKPHLEF
jgi:hypothetical protein